MKPNLCAPGLALAAVLLATTACSTSTPATDTDASPTPSREPAAAATESSPGTETQTTGFEPAKISWKPCQSKDLKGLKCATVQVPRDYADPAGPTIALSVSLKPHQGKTSRGVLMTNPGGPGSPGVPMAQWVSEFDKVLTSYDVVGIDPRGVGTSKPAMSCGTSEDKATTPLVPKTQADLDAMRSIAESYSTSCESTVSADLLPYITTANVAEDMDTVRKAMGADTISYWGNSYGTYLGQVYATLHPDRVERMLLDGVIGPSINWSQMSWPQTQALEANLPRFYAYIAKNPKLYHLGTDPQAIADRVLKVWNKLGKGPARKGKLDQRTFSQTLNTAAYGVSGWPVTAQALDMLLNKSDSRAFASEPMGVNPRAAYLGIMCNESEWPGFDTIIEGAKESAVKAPIFTWGEAWLSSPCPTWPGDPVQPVTIDPSGLTAPILLNSETYDGATPFSGALEARALFPTSALIEGKDGTTHSAAIGSSGCTKKAIVKFWTDGTLPERKPGDGADLVCPPVAVAGG